MATTGKSVELTIEGRVARVVLSREARRNSFDTAMLEEFEDRVEGLVGVVQQHVALAYGGDRPDVCASWPGYPSCNAVGYAGDIDPSVFGPVTGCPHLLEIVATDADGNARTIDRALVVVM